MIETTILLSHFVFTKRGEKDTPHPYRQTKIIMLETKTKSKNEISGWDTVVQTVEFASTVHVDVAVRSKAVFIFIFVRSCTGYSATWGFGTKPFMCSRWADTR